MTNSVSNVQITAVPAEFKNGKGFTVMVSGMDNKLDCKRNFTDPLKALRYMFVLQKRLDLQISRVDLAAVSLSYQRAKEALAKAKQDLDNISANATEEIKKVDAEQEAKEVETIKEQPTEGKSLMDQYNELKAKHPEALLLFRTGDFYETYEDDAVKASAALGITLTVDSKNKRRMAGFPYHALDSYLPKLIRSGHRVAICEALTSNKVSA